MLSMKKTGFVSVLGMSLVLTACGGDDTGGDNDDGVTTLHFWGGVPAENGPQEVVDEWNENNPDVQVEYSRYVNDDEGNMRVNTALQTGESIDILKSHSPNHLEQRVDSDFLLDLADYAGEFDIEGSVGPAAERWKMNDTYYAVPTNTNALFIMLNEDALEENGLEVPETWTWEEVAEYANELGSDFPYGYAIDHDTIHGIIQNALIDDGFVDENGESNLDHPNVREGLALYYDMMHEDGVMPVLSEQVATNMQPEQMFIDGEVGMYQAGAWRLRMLNDLDEYPRDFNVAFAPYPHFEGQSMPAHHVEDAMSIVAETDHPEEAWEFIEWYANEGMIHLAPGGRVPASEDGPAEEARELIVEGAEDTYNLDSLNSVYEIENTEMIVDPPYQVLDNITQELEMFFLGNNDLDTTIERMVNFHNDYLERNR
ncbi:ABC transporter substrate-binding protein [Alteribacter natronophilus]|uniref:ABC transporter substrate-binding protein n=1 Tax=Alteribacter natronophilus TaxID=2583810 RepID=UPI00110DB8A8|nr:extracellular solute-binding protein [Alteribacter natronophilus]TMW72277.1 extracellular solute-binding protein [Alteribacter natronophilus]